MRMRLRCGLHPVQGNDLPAFPTPLVEPQVSDLGHVAWLKAQVSPAIADSLRIKRPDDLLDAQGLEELALCKLKRTAIRSARNDCRKQVHPPAAIFKFAAGLFCHREIKHELRPIFTLGHLPQSDFAVITMAVQARAHG